MRQNTRFKITVLMGTPETGTFQGLFEFFLFKKVIILYFTPFMLEFKKDSMADTSL